MRAGFKLIRMENKYDLQNKFSYFITLRGFTFFIHVPVSQSDSEQLAALCGKLW